MMNIRFLKAAQEELDKAVEWYNQKSPGLGARFLTQVNVSLRRIACHPYLCAKIKDDIRRCLVNRFPYGLIYGVDEDKEVIVIIAVAHLHRKPGYWHKRVRREL
jgi:plasmid stabilization system protein ParE